MDCVEWEERIIPQISTNDVDKGPLETLVVEKDILQEAIKIFILNDVPLIVDRDNWPSVHDQIADVQFHSGPELLDNEQTLS